MKNVFADGKPLTIGQAARKAGVNVETLRYYERRRILPAPPRTISGYRAYPEEAVRIVRFVRRAQVLGFTLKEIQELLQLRRDPGSTCGKVRGAAERKHALVREKMRDLAKMEKALASLLQTCAGSGPIRGCPILEALEED